MAYVDMKIQRRPFLLVEFSPDAEVDFAPLKVTAPNLECLAAESDYRELIEEVVRRNCGQVVCEGVVALRFSPLSDSTKFPRQLLSSCVNCTAIDCPLDYGGCSDDREPRIPVVPRLIQQAELDEPTQS